MIKIDKGMVEFNGEELLIAAELASLKTAIKDDEKLRKVDRLADLIIQYNETGDLSAVVYEIKNFWKKVDEDD